jgi:hypothetical protein
MGARARARARVRVRVCARALPCQVAKAPDGNGGLYAALQSSGVLARMAAAGVEGLDVYCVDNVLARVADPEFIGCCHSRGSELGARVLAKAFPEEKVGVFARDASGRLRVRWLAGDRAAGWCRPGRMRQQAGRPVVRLTATNRVAAAASACWLPALGRYTDAAASAGAAAAAAAVAAAPAAASGAGVLGAGPRHSHRTGPGHGQAAVQLEQHLHALLLAALAAGRRAAPAHRGRVPHRAQADPRQGRRQGAWPEAGDVHLRPLPHRTAHHAVRGACACRSALAHAHIHVGAHRSPL